MYFFTTQTRLLLILLPSVTLAFIDDNMIPTQEEVENELLNDRQQNSIAVPSEEEKLNQLHPFMDLSRLFSHSLKETEPHNVVSSFPEIDARGFHELVFDGLEDYNPTWRGKRVPFGLSARGFHDDVFDQDFGYFHTVKKRNAQRSNLRDKMQHHHLRRKREIDGLNQEAEFPDNRALNESVASSFNKEDNSVGYPTAQKRSEKYSLRGLQRLLSLEPHIKRMALSDDIHDDAFTGGFGVFNPMKRYNALKTYHLDKSKRISKGGEDIFTHGFGDFDTMKKRMFEYYRDKRRLGMGSSGFHGDTFTGGFGDFDTMRKRRPGADFHGDTFTHGFGDFDTMRKRRPGADFHGDTFTQGFGDFDTMRKRRPGADFHGDTFTQGFGDFDTMKKRRPGADFHGDTFTHGFGDFETMKRRPGSDFHGDAFTHGFGDFETMKKRRPGAEFHGDTFTHGFGDFETTRKKRSLQTSSSTFQ